MSDMTEMRPVAIVTGSSRGIGSATALELAKQGHDIVVTYLTSEREARETAKEIDKTSRALLVQLDVANPYSVESLVAATIAHFGRIDVLVNNAGAILRPSDWRSISESTWQRTLGVNLTGAYHCIRETADIIKLSPSGRIINVTSTYGMMGAAPVIAYAAAKSALIALTRSFAKELAPVTVNAVAPGHIETDMTKSAGDEFLSRVIGATPLRRLGAPADVATAVAFLASQQAGFITGHVLVVDGGHILK
jgi:3-oxoacyl-[acyl-carrier protein] reductase